MRSTVMTFLSCMIVGGGVGELCSMAIVVEQAEIVYNNMQRFGNEIRKAFIPGRIEYLSKRKS